MITQTMAERYPSKDPDALQKVMWVGGDLDGQVAVRTIPDLIHWEKDRQDLWTKKPKTEGTSFYFLHIERREGEDFYIYYAKGQTREDIRFAMSKYTGIDLVPTVVVQIDCSECAKEIVGQIYMSPGGNPVCVACQGLPVTMARVQAELQAVKEKESRQSETKSEETQ